VVDIDDVLCANAQGMRSLGDYESRADRRPHQRGMMRTLHDGDDAESAQNVGIDSGDVDDCNVRDRASGSKVLATADRAAAHKSKFDLPMDRGKNLADGASVGQPASPTC
jgi:hypothetical protein